MNHGIYRLVFNQERNSWVAVAENVRGRGKKSNRRRLAAVVLGLLAGVGCEGALAAPPAVTALPVPSTAAGKPFVFAGTVTGGQPTTVGNTMTINSASRTLGLNWRSFDIGSSAKVEFVQPDTSSRVLNRIWDNNPTQIMGQLKANGQVYLINQNGILFGAGSQVNVGGLVASSLNLSESMTNKLLNYGLPSAKGDSLEFTWDGDVTGFNKGAVIVEAGAEIRSRFGGRVVLIAPKTVENRGLIARDETDGAAFEAILAAGGKVILTAPDDPSLRGLLVETQAVSARDTLGNNVALDGAATNSGQINAGTGGIASLAALAVNQKGIVNASKAVNINGTTMLVSGTTETDRLTINQRGSIAEIDWVSGFNVGAGKTLEFVQGSTGAVAYNYVYDPDRKAADGSALTVAGRSSIDGILKASGQFFLINEKGIDFGSSARVSANNFVASALGLNPTVVSNGLLMQDGVTTRAFYLNEKPAMDSAEAREAALSAFREATVNVNSGAVIESASNGYVILAGSKINQAGSISTPKGQTVLAAGADVYLKPAYAQAMRGFSPEVNPLYVVDASKNKGSEDPRVILSRGADANAVSNFGSISAAFGNITLVGHEITQAGVLSASTSATANGSIRLLARDLVAFDLTKFMAGDQLPLSRLRNLDSNGIAPYVLNEDPDSSAPLFITGTLGGSLTLAPGSRTQVVIDGSDGKTVSADQTFISSSVEAAARKIVVNGNVVGSDGKVVSPGAVVEAKGGRIQFRSSDTFDLTSAFAGDPLTASQTVEAPSGVGIFVGDGAKLDASGAVAAKKASDLFIQVELRGDEFADNPVQRNSVLRGEKAWVDIRDKVAIANLDGWTNKVAQTVEERAAAGGTISLLSTGSVIVKQGAQLDVSGGQVNYAAGQALESLAVTAGGKAYRLNDAPVGETYVVSRSDDSRTTEDERSVFAVVTRDVAAYTEGRSAGTVELQGHSLAVDGNLTAKTTIGERQRNLGDPAIDRYAVPLGGRLIVRDAGQHYALLDKATATDADKAAVYGQAQMTFVNGTANAAAGLGESDSAGPRLELSSSLVNAGFSRFDLRSDGRIDIPANVALNLAPGGSFKADGRQVYVAGDISVPSGTISLSTRDMSLSADSFPFPGLLDAKYSTLVVDDGASLSTAGRWINDYLDGAASTTAKAIKGGTITLSSAYDLDLRKGSALDVSGGARLDSKGKLEAGNAGSIVLSSGGVKAGGFDFTEDGQRRDASVFLDGKLSAYSLASGGKLEINTSHVTLGKTFDADSRNWTRDERLAADQVGVALDAAFFNRGGLYEFTLVGRDGVNVVKGAQIVPSPINWSLATVAGSRLKATGSDLASFAAPLLLNPALRNAPTKLALSTRSLKFGDLLVDEGAYLGVTPTGSISLESQAQLTVLGTLEARAGSITLSRPANRSDKPYNKDFIEFSPEKASESIYLGEHSQLLAGGAVVLSTATQTALDAGVSANVLRNLGRYRGTVLDGGKVSIDAGMGYLITRDGSLISVSGADALLNVATSNGKGGIAYPLQTVGSAGGSVSLAAREGMLLDGRYSAAGGSGALGGTFALRFADLEQKANPWDFLDSLPLGLSEDGKAAMLGTRNLMLYQSSGEHAALWPSSMDSSAYLSGGATIDQASFNGKTALDLASLQSGGFGSWYLTSQDAISFSGNIAASVNNHVRLDAATYSAVSDATRFSLKAASVEIGNFDVDGAAVAATTGKATASIDARDIGLVGTFTWNGFGDTSLVSQGEMHFDSIENVVAHRSGGRLFNGQLSATGNLTLSAARLSPATYSDFRVDLLADPAGSISITRPVGATADVSISPAGRLEFAAATIDHEGTVTAPLGEIVFKSPTGSVTLGKDSVTSVAADRDLLLGYTIDSGTKWLFDATRWSRGTFGVTQIARATYEVTQAPAKSIVIDSANTKVESGAKLDLSGGGEAIAWEFSAGPTGKTDALQSSTSTFAILPASSGNAGWNGFSATDGNLQQVYNVTAVGSGYSSVPSLKAGDRIVLGDNPAGISGAYVLLPARYALLPGAYLVTVKSGGDSVLAGAKVQADGSWLVSGSKLAVNADGSTTAYAQRALTLELAGSSVVAKRAKYLTTTASEFFYDSTTSALPGDAGQLSVVGRSNLYFDPVVVAMRAAEIVSADGQKRAGVGLALDLAAPNMLITDSVSTADESWSVLDQNKLNALNASSLLLGGTRSLDSDSTHIETIASKVLVQNGGVADAKKTLQAPEIMISATDDVSVAAGSRIEAVGEATGRSVVLNGNGAFLSASSGAQGSVSRLSSTNPSPNGDLLLAEGATVAGRSQVFDATRNNTLAGVADLGALDSNGKRSGGYINIGAGRINVVGDQSQPSDGLTLDNADLARFVSADQLRLTSYSTLDLYGNAQLGTSALKELAINAAGIAGHGDASQLATLAAKSILFENLNPGSAQYIAGSALGSGGLLVSAETIRFGGNATATMRSNAGSAAQPDAKDIGFAIRGFSDNAKRAASAAVNLQASGDLRFENGLSGAAGTLSGVTVIDNAGGNGTAPSLAVSAARVTTVDAADHLLINSGVIRVSDSGGVAGSAAGLGGSLEMRGKAIDVAGRLETPSGKLVLAATGSDVDTNGNALDHVTLRNGAMVSANGSTVAFADTHAYSPAGTITLRSASGNVEIQEGAVVSVSGAAEGGDAGQLNLEAKRGKVSAAAGSLRATASAGDSAANRGQLIVDASTVALDELAAAVKQSLPEGITATSFTEKWDIRRRVGDLGLSQEIKASSVKLATDAGNIDISGRIDASGSKGGDIELYANRGAPTTGGAAVGGRIDLRAGSVLDASAKDVVAGGQGTSGQGGKVIVGVSATNATDELNTAINFEAAKDGKAAASIDVSTPAGSAAASGKVTFRAPRQDVVSPLVSASGSVLLGNQTLSVPLPTGYRISPTTPVSSIRWGTTISVRLPDNSAGQVTLDLSGLGSKTVLRADGTALADGDLVSATTGKVLVYDGTAYRISPTVNSAIPATPTATTGTGSAYALTGTLPAAWGVVAFTAKAVSSAAPTLKIGTAVAKKILNSDGTPLAAGAIKNNAQVLVVYDGTNFRLSPTTPTIARQINLAPGSSGVNFQVAEVTPAATLVAGTVVSFTAQAAAKVGATLRVGDNDTKALLAADGSALTANAFVAQQGVVAVYDGTAFRISTAAAADTGTANTYKVTQSVATSTDLKVGGYTVTFRAKNANTKASTIGITTADSKSITVALKRADGSAVEVNDIKANELVTAVYTVIDAAAGTGEFRIVNNAELATGLTTGSSMAPVSLAGNVTGASSVALEGVRTSRYNGDLALGSQQQAKLLSGTAQAVAAKGAEFVSTADADGHLGVVFRPGEELRATGTITVASDWNLGAARYASQPGALTLRAEGDLNINGTISDGFVANGSNTAVSRDARLASSGDSWTYRLVAGADTAAASLLETKESGSTGNITVATNKLVRTGTGSIDMAALRDIKLFDRAAVYTAGVAATTQPDGFSPISNPGQGQNVIYSSFPYAGADLSLSAGQRIVMVSTGATLETEKDPVQRGINQWLYRAGSDTVDLQWWPRIASFQQGVAAFGGGNVSLDAGSEIKNFTAVIPTNGRVPTIDGERQPDLAVVQGGGNLSVHTDGAVIGGQFYAETGQLRIKAAELDSNVALALGNAAARVVVSGDAALGNVFNPLWATSTTVVVNSGQTPVQLSNNTYQLAMRFGTYGESTALDLVSVGGQVTLKSSDTVNGLKDAETMRLAPSRVKVVALNGDIVGAITQAPGNDGQLDLLAAGSIKLNDSAVRQLDISPDTLPSIRNPLPDGNFRLLKLATEGTPTVQHSSTDWHSGDSEPSRLIALSGDISAQGGASNFASFSEAVRVQAAGDITDLSIVAQHRNANAVTSVSAGGDIQYSKNGGLLPSLGLAVSGPGRLEVTAGGSIELADTRGIVSRGNLDNPYLPEGGASIFAMAGAKADYNAFRKYLKVGAEVSDVELRDRFYTMLRDYGREAVNGGGEASYEKGRAVISILFPNANVSGGDINLFASQIKTEQGGNVDLLTPGGSVIVGVADPSIKKKGSEQGLFTLSDGSIRAFVKNNFLVNQSRVFTLDGGDILVWADTGSIDAGSGAKTVSSTPPPALVIRNGQVVLDTTNSVSGSGIGVLASRDDTQASDMDLFAPQGAIDAGDAGLRSTGNINLGARVVLNANNIQAAGSVAGAPAPVAAAAPVAMVTTPTNNENKALEEAGPAAGNKGGAGGMLTVEVLDSEPASGAPQPAAAPARSPTPSNEEERKRKSRSAG